MANINNSQEEDLVSCPLPKNFADSGRCFNGMFRTRNLVEGVIFAAPIAYGTWHTDFSYDNRILLTCMTAGIVFLLCVVGINGDSVSEFFIHMITFNRRKRVAKYNPRVKSEATPEYLTNGDYEFPIEKLRRIIGEVSNSAVDSKENEISRDVSDPHYKEFYADDIGVLQTPDDLKTKSELRKEKKERKKAEKIAAAEKKAAEKAAKREAKIKAKEDKKKAKYKRGGKR